MRNRVKTIAAAVGVTAITIVGVDAATYAGTGDSLILGKFNKANKPTHIKNTGKGPALSLHAKGKRPALAVDSKAKIVRLNADRVDGKHAAALQNNVRVYTATPSGTSNTKIFRLPNFPNGRYQATYSVYLDGSAGSGSDPAESLCYLSREGGQAAFAGYTMATSVWSNIGLSASDVIYKNDANWLLRCESENEWTIEDNLPVRVTLTKVDKTIGDDLEYLVRTSPEASALSH